MIAPLRRSIAVAAIAGGLALVALGQHAALGQQARGGRQTEAQVDRLASISQLLENFEPMALGDPGERVAWTAVQRYIFMEELMQAAVPLPLQFNCFMVGPVIAQFGNEEQKAHFLPKTANADIWWCQGFSEPGSGSDLASLRTRVSLSTSHACGPTLLAASRARRSAVHTS